MSGWFKTAYEGVELTAYAPLLHGHDRALERMHDSYSKSSTDALGISF